MRANSSLLIEYIKKEMSLFAKYKRHFYSYNLVLIFYASLLYLRDYYLWNVVLQMPVPVITRDSGFYKYFL